MSDIVKALRMPKKDWEQIERFLSLNPFFDFSTLARTAISEFIKNPKLDLKGVGVSEKKLSRQTVKSRQREVRNGNSL